MTYDVKLECGWPGQHGFVRYGVNADDAEEAEAKARARARREHLVVVAIAEVREVCP